MILFHNFRNEEAIVNTFTNLILLANRMFTLVLVVGNEQLYEDVSRGITLQFVPHPLRPNPPVVRRITVDTAVQLTQFGFTQWAPDNRNNVNAEVAAHLANPPAPFIFYRDGAECNLHEADDVDNAVTEISNLFINV